MQHSDLAMHPSHFLELFPAFPQSHRVFVAMSFAEEFKPRWEQVIERAIRGVRVNDEPLEPFRVDVRRVISDSILTEILDSISTARLILADISTIGHLGDTAVRSGNVMYELGIAQACRLPEEILLFRSDSDPLLFDVANVRVNLYDPDGDPAGARATVGNAIVDASKEIDLKKQLSVRKGAQNIDGVAFGVLAAAATPNGLPHPELTTARQVLGNVQHYNAIQRLLELGTIETIYPKIQLKDVDKNPDAKLNISYKATPYGRAVLEHIATCMGADDPGLMKAAKRLLR